METNSPPEFQPAFYGPRYWPTWVALGLFRLLAWIPVPIALILGRLVGDLFFYLARSRRRIAEINIGLCFPQLSSEQQKQLVRKVMHSAGKSIVESAIAMWGPEWQLRPRYSITGLEHIEAAQARGQGVLLTACHFTTMDPIGRIMSFHFKFDMLYRKDANPLLAYEMIKARERYISETIVRSDTRHLIKNLRQGHVVWYAPDQDYGAKHSVFAPFFGIPAATVVGTARIAQLGKAAVLPLAHYRDDTDNHYHLIIGAPLENFPTGNDVADATRINQVIEAAVSRQPDQYLWVHRRFKTRPPGEPAFYQRSKRTRHTQSADR